MKQIFSHERAWGPFDTFIVVPLLLASLIIPGALWWWTGDPMWAWGWTVLIILGLAG